MHITTRTPTPRNFEPTRNNARHTYRHEHGTRNRKWDEIHWIDFWELHNSFSRLWIVRVLSTHRHHTDDTLNNAMSMFVYFCPAFFCRKPKVKEEIRANNEIKMHSTSFSANENRIRRVTKANTSDNGITKKRRKLDGKFETKTFRVKSIGRTECETMAFRVGHAGEA